MLVEKAFNLLLQEDTGVSAIVSGRVYSGNAPQTATYPLIAHRTEGRSHIISLKASNGLRRTRFRVFSAAKTYAAAKNLDEAVRLAIQDFRGVVSDTASPPDTLRIQLIECESSIDMPFDDATKTHQVVSDYTVTAHEEVPS